MSSGPLDFDDEHGEAPPRRSAAVGARPADRAPTAAPPPPPRPSSGTPYLWVVGAAAVVLVSLLLLTTIRQGTDRGAHGVPVGDVMPPFAVPTALGPIDADANIARHAGEGQAGERAACTVRGPDILNGCALREAGPVVLAFFAIRSRECVAQLDAMQRVRAQLPGVQLAAISIRGDRGDLRKLVRRHGWSFPVGYDRDGALSNAYHVQVCPQLTFARRGGRVVETTFGTLAPAALAAKARSLG
jgi:AhpC/TSA family